MPETPLDQLIKRLSRLPGLGPRSAQRTALFLLKNRDQMMLPLAAEIDHVGRHVRACVECGNLDMQDKCSLCMDTRRDHCRLCVVEDVSDLWAMERAGVFAGLYHVLGGTLSALDAVGPEDLHIPKLVDRVATEGVREVILALNATIDGQTTAHYIAEQFGPEVN